MPHLDIYQPKNGLLLFAKKYIINQDAIDGVNGTYIQVFVPHDLVIRFWGRKPYPIQNILVAVVFDIEFTHILMGGISAHALKCPEKSRWAKFRLTKFL